MMKVMKKNRGLTTEYIRELSARKKEPKWMLELRLLGLSYWEKLKMSAWAPDITELNLDDILMYVEPKKEMVGSWDEVPVEIRETFEQLGIPEAEREHLAGVGAQYDSEVIYHNLKEQIAKKGVVYLPMEEAVATTQKPREEVIRQYGVDVAEILKKHFMKLISESDHKFAALHAAVWSGGSFIYVPKNVSVEIPIQSYYRLNAPGAGQFEHTLIIVDEGSDLHFIEGCSAPKYTVSNLHAGSVELYVKKNSRLKFSTVESWSKNVFNLNTKRAYVEEDGSIEWVTGSFGSRISMLYPMGILAGARAKMEYTGVTFAGAEQNLDTGAKVVHIGPNTYSMMMAKSLSKDGGISTTRTLAKICKTAVGAKSYTDCKSLILDDKSISNAIPEVKVECDDAEVSHEASVGKISDEAIYYLKTRGISEDEARAMIVRGFTGDISKELPIEYAMEMNNLIKMEMEGTA